MTPSSALRPIVRVDGRAIVLPGDDIDTDRIMPARFLRAVTFDGLETHVFADDRLELAARGAEHPFDVAARRDARILLVGANFGCGSSREHAPQALIRWGIQAIVGVSFSEIFSGNALMIGLACVRAGREDLERLAAVVDADPGTHVVLDLETRTIATGSKRWPVTLPDSARHALLSGEWDGTSLLLDRYVDVERFAAGLPKIATPGV